MKYRDKKNKNITIQTRLDTEKRCVKHQCNLLVRLYLRAMIELLFYYFLTDLNVMQ